MRYTASYIIRGKPELETRIRERQLDRLDYVVGPFLWTNEQGGRTAYDTDDYTAAVKRLFVAHLKHVALQPQDVDELFGDLPIGDAAFDRWWTTEVFQGIDESAPDVVEQLRRGGHLAALQQVGLPLVGA